MPMPDDKDDDFIDDWLTDSDVPVVTRGYKPTSGPAEPDVAPPGRASLSPPEPGQDPAVAGPAVQAPAPEDA
jgi:hypothetical protein